MERLERTGESELAHLKLSHQSGDELTAEDATEYAAGSPDWNSGSVHGTGFTGGDQAVDMRVSEQVLAPGMQDGEEADLRSQVFGVGGVGLALRQRSRF